MFDHFSTEQWQVFIGFAGIVLAFVVTPVLTVAIWTLRYIIKVEKHTSASAASTDAIVTSFDTFKDENEKDHEIIHERISKESLKNETRFKDVDAKTGEHDKKLVKHGVHIESLLDKGCQS